MQLRRSLDPQHEIWCVPSGFDEEFVALNGLCTVTGPFAAGNLNPQGVVIRISSDVGRLHVAPGSSLSFDEGNGAHFYKEECIVERPQNCETVAEKVGTVETEENDLGRRVRKPTDNT